MANKHTLIGTVFLILTCIFSTTIFLIITIYLQRNADTPNSPTPAPTTTASPTKYTNTSDTYTLLTPEEINKYYEAGTKRFSVSYVLNAGTMEDEYTEEIFPKLKILIAYAEYQIQQKQNLFLNSNFESIDKIYIVLFEDYTRVSSNPNMAKRVVVFAASEFTGTIRGYIDYNNPELTDKELAISATHEVIHILQYAYKTNSVTTTLPKWFKEGMSEYHQTIPYYLKNKYTDTKYHTIPENLNKLELLFQEGSYDELINAYIVATDFYSYLSERVDQKKLISLLGTTGNDEEFENQFKEITGKATDEWYTSFFLSSFQ